MFKSCPNLSLQECSDTALNTQTDKQTACLPAFPTTTPIIRAETQASRHYIPISVSCHASLDTGQTLKKTQKGLNESI